MKQEQFLQENTIDGGFFQSKHWASFQKRNGAKVFEFENENFRTLVIEHKLPIAGSYWYVPRGPVLKIKNYKDQIPNKVQNKIGEIVRKAKKQKIGWIRIEPQNKEILKAITRAIKNYDQSLKTTKSKKSHQPAQTLMIDLRKREQELLSEMKSKTRYNIKLSSRKGVKFFTTKNEKDVETFCELLEETAKRDGIKIHPKEHYKTMLKNNKAGIMKLYLASFHGKILAGAIVSFFGETATYLHGVSSNMYRNVMAPYGLQWQIMKEAKRGGMKKYDLGGTKLKKTTDGHEPENGNWKGISRFKQGFCPKNKPTNFPGCHDFVLSQKKYFLYRTLQTIKDLKR